MDPNLAAASSASSSQQQWVPVAKALADLQEIYNHAQTRPRPTPAELAAGVVDDQTRQMTRTLDALNHVAGLIQNMGQWQDQSVKTVDPSHWNYFMSMLRRLIGIGSVNGSLVDKLILSLEQRLLYESDYGIDAVFMVKGSKWPYAIRAEPEVRVIYPSRMHLWLDGSASDGQPAYRLARENIARFVREKYDPSFELTADMQVELHAIDIVDGDEINFKTRISEKQRKVMHEKLASMAAANLTSFQSPMIMPVDRNLSSALPPASGTVHRTEDFVVNYADDYVYEPFHEAEANGRRPPQLLQDRLVSVRPASAAAAAALDDARGMEIDDGASSSAASSAAAAVSHHGASSSAAAAAASSSSSSSSSSADISDVAVALASQANSVQMRADRNLKTGDTRSVKYVPGVRPSEAPAAAERFARFQRDSVVSDNEKADWNVHRKSETYPHADHRERPKFMRMSKSGFPGSCLMFITFPLMDDSGKTGHMVSTCIVLENKESAKGIFGLIKLGHSSVPQLASVGFVIPTGFRLGDENALAQKPEYSLVMPGERAHMAIVTRCSKPQWGGHPTNRESNECVETMQTLMIFQSKKERKAFKPDVTNTLICNVPSVFRYHDEVASVVYLRTAPPGLLQTKRNPFLKLWHFKHPLSKMEKWQYNRSRLPYSLDLAMHAIASVLAYGNSWSLVLRIPQQMKQDGKQRFTAEYSFSLGDRSDVRELFARLWTGLNKSAWEDTPISTAVPGVDWVVSVASEGRASNNPPHYTWCWEDREMRSKQRDWTIPYTTNMRQTKLPIVTDEPFVARLLGLLIDEAGLSPRHDKFYYDDKFSQMTKFYRLSFWPDDAFIANSVSIHQALAIVDERSTVPDMDKKPVCQFLRSLLVSEAYLASVQND